MVFNKKMLQLTTGICVGLVAAQVGFAHSKHHAAAAQPAMDAYKGEPVNMFVPSWYVGANVGVSHTHDKASPGSGNSVTQIGPGFSVDLGYQFAKWYNILWAGEIGYTQYHESSESAPNVNIANTEHFSSYIAAVAQIPLAYNFNLFGKFGLAYSYAKKVFEATGASGSANAYSPYYGGGISYNVTPTVALNLQWARARGNSSTGSTDLSSLGISWNFG